MASLSSWALCAPSSSSSGHKGLTPAGWCTHLGASWRSCGGPIRPMVACRAGCNKRAFPLYEDPIASHDTTILMPTPEYRHFCGRDPTQPPCWIPPLIFFGLATLFSAVILKNRQRKPAVAEQDEVLIPPSPEVDPRGYKRALARTRQGTYISKAVAFTKAGDPARGYMELTRALAENSICRSPLLEGHHTKEELVELYKLHIKYSDVPANFATLLQLQEMLGLEQDEAEKIELEVMQAPGAFSI